MRFSITKIPLVEIFSYLISFPNLFSTKDKRRWLLKTKGGEGINIILRETSGNVSAICLRT
jgi:hypothetical protein